MAAPTVQTIKALLEAGTYPVTLKFFTIEQSDERRKYPSVEVVDVKPSGTAETEKEQERNRTFEVRIYQKTVGDNITPTDNQTTIETQILTILENATLEDHKLVFENKDWTRRPVLEGHPHYIISILRVSTRLVTIAPTPDGLLTFDLSESSVDSPPAGDYTYTQCFDTSFDDGYRDVEEQITSNPDGVHIPVRYTGGYSGTFITNVYVKTADLGSTGEKLNRLNRLRSTGEKPIIGFIYTNKDATLVNPVTITEMFKIRVDRVNRVYSTSDNTLFRVVGKMVGPSTIT